MADETDGGATYDPVGDSQALPEMSSDGSVDSFTETTSVSWFQKLGQAIVGVLIGLVMILGFCALLFWNEGRAVKTAKSLAEGEGLVVDAPSDRVQPGNEGKLVHVQGDLATTSPLVDPALGVEGRGVRLIRVVEMYQWKETSHTETHKRVGGGEDRTTTYSYSREWHEGRVDSSRFHSGSGHENPQQRFSRTELVARDGRIGEFRPGPAALGLLDTRETLTLDAAVLDRVRARLGTNSPVQLEAGNLYLGADPSSPRVGDLRITYQLAPLGAASLIGRQSGADLQEYQTKAGDRLLMARYGLVPAADMFAGAEADNRALTWILRFVAAICLWIGFFLVLRPIAVVGDLVPVIGTMLGAGAGIAALILTLGVAPFVIAIAWLVYRPLVGIGILVVGAGIAYGLHMLAVRRRGARPMAATGAGPLPAGARG